MLRLTPSLALIALLLAGCSRGVNTLPPLADTGDPVKASTLYVPEDYVVESVSYEAAVFSNAEPGQVTGPRNVQGRAFVKVFARHRESGEQVLLVYENVAARPWPVQVLRFEARAMELPR